MYINVNMANDSRYYYSLPMQAPQQPRSTSGSRRPPLTPSTVSSPCLTTQSTIASRRDSGSGSPTKASALLAKVASHPPTPRGETPASSPMPSPDSRMHPNPMYSPDRPAMWRSESARYVHQYRQQGKHVQPDGSSLLEANLSQDGYISFPDFEKVCQAQNPYQSQRREHNAVQT